MQRRAPMPFLHCLLAWHQLEPSHSADQYQKARCSRDEEAPLRDVHVTPFPPNQGRQRVPAIWKPSVSNGTLVGLIRRCGAVCVWPQSVFSWISRWNAMSVTPPRGTASRRDRDARG